MNTPAPHYLLLADTSGTEWRGGWRFVLRPLDGSEPIEVTDVEPDIWGERLDLLTVVRGLESLDQPSRVTVVGCSRYVEQGIMYGLAEWRENQWRWECFGQMVPVRDADLWQRMDRILQFHRVDCRQRRFDPPHDQLAGPNNDRAGSEQKFPTRFASQPWIKCGAMALVAWSAVWLESAWRYWQTGARLAAVLTSSLVIHRT